MNYQFVNLSRLHLLQLYDTRSKSQIGILQIVIVYQVYYKFSSYLTDNTVHLHFEEQLCMLFREIIYEHRNTVCGQMWGFQC